MFKMGYASNCRIFRTLSSCSDVKVTVSKGKTKIISFNLFKKLK